MSFEKITELVENGDFIYLDPPYHPLNGNSFTTYAKGNFLDDEQRKLAEIFRQLDKRGCLCMQSNSDTEFIKKLYSGYDTKTVKAKRAINCRGDGRGEINEVVITNY